MDLETPVMPPVPSTPLAPVPPMAPPPFNPQPQAIKSHRGVFIAIAVIILLAIGAGATAAWKGWIYNPFSHGPTGPEIFTAFSSITSAHTITTINAGFEPRGANGEPIDFTVAVPAPKKSSGAVNGAELGGDFGDATEHNDSSSAFAAPSVPTFLRLIPGDLSFNLKLTSDWQKAETLADTQTRIEGTYSANNIQAVLDLEVRRVGEKTYIQPTKIPLPIPVIDLTVLSNKWIDGDFKGSAISDVLDYSFKKDSPEIVQTMPADVSTEAQEWMKEAYKNGGIAIGDAKRETLDGIKVWTYAISFNGEKIRAAFLTVADNRSRRIGDQDYQIFTDKAIENMKDDAQSAVATAILDQLTGSASVRQDNNLPAAISFSVKIAPKTDNEKFQNKQISISVATSFSNINKPVGITAPEDAITFTQAMGLVTGKTQEEMNFDQQESAVRNLRTALKAYNTDKSMYPATLQDLLGYESKSFRVKTVPGDLFTNAPFGYQLTDKGYSLTYTIHFTDGISEFTQKKYIDGVNTATAANLSEEAAALTDYDEDGLTTAQENEIGTSDHKDDTDGDGFTDKEEVDGGFDPLTNSKTGATTKSSVTQFTIRR